MKKLLLLTKTLLAVALLCVGQNAWAADTSGKVISGSTVTETFDFNGWGLINLGSKTTATIGKASETADHSIGETAVYEVTNPVGNVTSATLELYNRFAMSNPGSDRSNYQVLFYNSDKSGNRAYFGGTAKSGYLSILDLPENAEITFEVEGTITFQSSNVKVKNSDAVTPGETTITGGTTYVVTTAGDVDFSHTTWSGFKKVVITYEVDEELVTAPTIAVAYNGANRTVTITSGTSSESNPVTTYYTTDGTTPTSSSNVYSAALDISSNCTVKAVTISNKATSSDIASEEVTVGKLTLNAPTFTKTEFSAGSYTCTIAADQSSLVYAPASTTIKYRVGSTGDYATYTSAISVPAGEIVYAYAEADKYTTSSTSEVCAVVLPAMTKAFGQNYAGVVDADLSMAVSAGPTVTNAKSTSDPNYFIPSNDGGTSALTNENISFYFNKHATDATQDKKWQLKTTGMYADYTRGYANVKIENLTEGQIVEVSASAINSVTGLTELTTYSYGTTHYYVTTATTAYLNIERQKYVYSINVYDLDNEVVGAMNYTTGYYSAWNTTPIWINAGETAYYKFKNYNNGGNVLYQNWYLFGATEASENVVIFGPNHSNTGGEYIQKPTFTNADLNGATVEMATTLADAGDGTYTLTTTGVTTKADGTTTLSPNLVYTQTGLTASKLKLYVSVENSWLALQEEAIVASISPYGWATFSSDNALDFSKATTGLEAYMITGHSGNVVTKSQVTGTVPAGTGLLLKGDEGSYNIPVVASSETNVEANLMKAGTGADVSAESGKTKYVLGISDGGEAEFQKITDDPATVVKGKAYLQFDEVISGARSMRFADDITAVENVEAAPAEAKAQDGKFIENGKLVIVKNGVKYNAAGAQVK